MSASTTVTIWCNGCGDWNHTGSTAREARQYAKQAGWKVNQPSTEVMPSDPTAASLWSPNNRRDFCPDCANARADKHDLVKASCTYAENIQRVPCGNSVVVPPGTDLSEVRCRWHQKEE